MKFFLIVGILLVMSLGYGEEKQTRVSKIYAIGKTSEEPLFVQTTELQNSTSGSFTSNAKIEDPSGKLIMTEKVIVKDELLVSQYVEQLQSQEAWDLSVKDGYAIFKTFKLSDGRSSPQGNGKSEKLEKSFINGPLIETFINKNWEKLVSGDTASTAFSVLELERSVNFKLQKVKMSERRGRPVLVIKMKPANFLISVLVDPILLEFDSSTRKLVYFKGRTPLKIREGEKLKPLDAEIFYE